MNICQCTPQKFDEWIPHFSWFQNAKLLAKKSLIVVFFGWEVKVSTFTTPGKLRKWNLAKKTYEKRTCTLVFHTPCEDRCFYPQTPPEKACKGVLSHTSKRVRYFLGRDGLMEDGSGGRSNLKEFCWPKTLFGEITSYQLSSHSGDHQPIANMLT